MQQGLRHPARLVPLAFAGLIAIGTLLLMLPASRVGGDGAPWLTALFTATSAACVTGLAIVDTPTYWTGFGQAVILALFQLGGFGIMAGATLLGLLVLDRLGLGARLLAQAETRAHGLGDVGGVLRLVLGVTLVVELAVAALLAWRLHDAHGEDPATALWNGAFHAVSAFNNAGFSTYSDSVVRFASDPWFLVPVMAAVVIGAIGFPVLFELRRRAWPPRRWSVHTRITLLGSLVLVVGGTLAIALAEWNNPGTLGALSGADRWLNAAFHSVVARTAGFNSVDVGAMQVETLAVHYVLMFIGGGSAGTAGGIKVTTFVILGCVVWAEASGSRDTTVFGRRLSHETQRQAVTVVLLAMTVLALATLALLALTALPLEVVMFEAISAFATVGLSTGITASLPPAALVILVVLMFVGRVGTITVATALALRARPRGFRLPEERPIVG